MNALFIINPDTQEIDLNKEWIFMIPEFNQLLRRDKGSPKDYRGDRKLKARKELTWIHLMLAFNSPLRAYDDDARLAEALRCTGLTQADIDAEIMVAHDKYHEMMYEAAPSLRTLESLKKGLTSLNKYFAEVNFETVDSLKRQKYTAKEYIDNIKNLPAMNKAIKEFENMVEEELKEDGGIRGKKKLGLTEGARKSNWSEGGPPADDGESIPRETIEL